MIVTKLFKQKFLKEQFLKEETIVIEKYRDFKSDF